MNQILLLLHSLNRFILLILLMVVTAKAFMGWMNKSTFTTADNKLSLFLFISTHTQLLLGLILYFVSPIVIFSGAAMKDSIARYWLVEHITGMLIAIVLISVARISAKKLVDDTAKHRRMFILNVTALLVILVMIGLSHRGLLGIS